MSPILILHIGAGSIGILTGAVALVVRKGARLHRAFGTMFFAAMLLMSALGGYLAVLVPSYISVNAAALTFYLVATAWMTVRRGENRVGAFEYAALAAALGIAAGGCGLAVLAAAGPKGTLQGLPPAGYLPFAVVAALAAAMDLKVVRRGGIAGPQRIARHLWRMCAALLIAAFSFFIGQQKVMPLALRGSPLLFLPEIAIVATMIFWLFRVPRAARFRAAADTL